MPYDKSFFVPFNVSPGKPNVLGGVEYPLFRKAIDDYQSFVKTGLALGGLGAMELPLEGIGFSLADIQIDEAGRVQAEIKPCDSPIGKRYFEKLAARKLSGEPVFLAVKGQGDTELVNGRKVLKRLFITSVFLVDDKNNEILPV